MRWRSVAVLAVPLVGGCATVNVGQPAAGEARAKLIGDPSFNAGLPVTVVIRKIDDVELGPFESRAALAPGPHHVIVDCAVAGTLSKTRFVLDIDADPGARYHLVADLAPGNHNCNDVQVESR